MKVLTYKWSISRGRDTYGYNICTLWDGKTAYRCSGGGYDLVGTVFGEWLITHYRPEIEAIKDINDLYGLTDYEGKRLLDGACGFNCVQRVAESIGLNVMTNHNRKGHLLNIIITKNGE